MGADPSRRPKADRFSRSWFRRRCSDRSRASSVHGVMATTRTATIANDSPFCDAWAAMEKIIERLLAMATEGAGVDEVTRLLATDGTAMLRDLVQGYVDRCAAQERRVEVVGAGGIERCEVRTSSRRVETPVGEIEVKRLLYQALRVDGIAPLDAALGLPDEKYSHELRRIVAEESAKSSFDEVAELIVKHTGARKSTRPRPTNKRVWASVSHTPQRVIDHAFAEAARRDPAHRRRWVVLVDGNRDQLRRIQRAAGKLGVSTPSSASRRRRSCMRSPRPPCHRRPPSNTTSTAYRVYPTAITR
jgi:hypothetical protein